MWWPLKVRWKPGTAIYEDKGDRQHAPRLGGIGAYCQENSKRLPEKKLVRCACHLQRGGRPNAFDRMLATNWIVRRAGARRRQRAEMVALQAGDVITVPLPGDRQY